MCVTNDHLCICIFLFTQINAEDIDFHQKGYDLLRREEEHRMYPPKFSVGITGLDGARSTRVRLCFFGADKKMATDIPLRMPVQGMIHVCLFCIYTFYSSVIHTLETKLPACLKAIQPILELSKQVFKTIITNQCRFNTV